MKIYKQILGIITFLFPSVLMVLSQARVYSENQLHIPITKQYYFAVQDNKWHNLSRGSGFGIAVYKPTGHHVETWYTISNLEAYTEYQIQIWTIDQQKKYYEANNCTSYRHPAIKTDFQGSYIGKLEVPDLPTGHYVIIAKPDQCSHLRPESEFPSFLDQNFPHNL